ncbi:hypothetical protein AB0F46_31855 [Streptomyces sp. NPDC026665]|uniref:hypothetical protein n=1 Tax=Streptomyces sp. NPDC026665 TaxID=3154798 RepID=UPI003403A238
MTEAAGPDADDACAWAERLGWAFGLVAEDPAARGAALAHLTEAQRKVTEALNQSNKMWWLTRHLGTDEQYREPAFRQARQRHRQVQRRSLPDGVWNAPLGANLATWPGLPYALLFLEWEARYPLEWTQYAKEWGTKESLIRQMARAPHQGVTMAKLTDLVELVVNRPYRCKDREYVRVARAVDSADLRGRLGRAAHSDSPWARCHAGYVLWLLDRPDLPNTRRVWQTWVAGEAASLL